MEGSTDRVHDTVNHRIEEALVDPNLTQQEREKICHIHLEAIETARESAIRCEQRGTAYDACLQEALRRCEEQVSAIRGQAANRMSRRKENF